MSIGLLFNQCVVRYVQSTYTTKVHKQTCVFVIKKIMNYSELAVFVFVLCLVCPMLPVSLDGSFSIAHSVFSNVYCTHCRHGAIEVFTKCVFNFVSLIF